MPPKWTPSRKPTKLPEDSGTYFRDKNAARFPEHPMEPAVVAALTTEPGLPCTVDIVACGSTLGNLLRFVRGDDKAFRMSLELVHGTTFLIRRENSPKETIRGIRGHGHTFPEANTTWDPDVKGSASHQRVLRYSFGGLGLLVRFESDGYISDTATKRVLPSTGRSSDTTAIPTPDMLSDMLSSNDISLRTPAGASKLEILKGGSLVSQSAVFDLKTRGAWKRDQDILGEEIPRLWVAQIPKFILAFHHKGVFDDVQVQDVTGKVKSWERQNAGDLRHLAALLHRLVKLLSERPDGRMEVRHTGSGTLEVYSQLSDVYPALSPGSKALWKTGRDMANNSGGEVGSGSDEEDKSNSDG
jgi:hypothetical protein